ncbi:flavodoxin domain-containing protein [Oricola cellulosilytica]|uniref:Flavodoxin domain-containing protein n=1 Tax=Oricola cellulosilytica TaxID=1429082 RepID=A0A4R0PC23_9HYPH|nr:flavodoxin domain-containing protein [Oricola cellulosilytica]TCD14083.1 hypothetical protein E0D97_08290 [Oricola cellulosilytica]
MKGVIFFSSRYGSTAQYAQWIAEATGLPSFDVEEESANPSDYDFLVLGSPVIYHKLMFHKWVKRNLASIMSRPAILFSVSGAGPGRSWMAGSRKAFRLTSFPTWSTSPCAAVRIRRSLPGTTG